MSTWSVIYRVETQRAHRAVGGGNALVDAATAGEAGDEVRRVVARRYAGERVHVVIDQAVDTARLRHGGDLHLCNTLAPDGCR